MLINQTNISKWFRNKKKLEKYCFRQKKEKQITFFFALKSQMDSRKSNNFISIFDGFLGLL